MRSTLKQAIVTLCLMVLTVAATSSVAQSALQANADVPQGLRQKLTESIELASQNQLQIVSLKLTELPNIYEVELNTGEMLYSDISGDYLFAGDMYQTTPAGLLNLSAVTRQVRIQEKIEAVPEDEMIIFTPDEIKATITVFTDVDCTYCRALHRDLEKLLDYGIQVRYMAYPRGGEDADSFSKMISVWCSDDRHKSLTQAKNGQNIPAGDCDSPVLAHYELGNEIGISGTPALVFPDGRVIPGYMEADRLAAMLEIN
jgi:thiol:disulfide interchange protein DsbC